MLKIKEDKVVLHYEGFDYIPYGGEDGYYIDEFDYEVDRDEVIDLLDGVTCDNVETINKLINEQAQTILKHYENDAMEHAIDKYKNGNDEE